MNCWREFPSGAFWYKVPERCLSIFYMVFEVGAEKNILLWADFFYTGNFGDPTSNSFLLFLWQKCRKYPSILDSLEFDWPEKQLKGLAFENALIVYQKTLELSLPIIVKEQQETRRVLILDTENIHFDSDFWIFGMGPHPFIKWKSLGSSLKLAESKFDVIMASVVLSERNPNF